MINHKERKGRKKRFVGAGLKPALLALHGEMSFRRVLFAQGSASEYLPQRRKDAKYTKFEARNPKQIQMIKMGKIQNKLPADSAFWIFFRFGIIWLRFVSVRGAAFVLRISDFLKGVSNAQYRC